MSFINKSKLILFVILWKNYWGRAQERDQFHHTQLLPQHLLINWPLLKLLKVAILLISSRLYGSLEIQISQSWRQTYSKPSNTKRKLYSLSTTTIGIDKTMGSTSWTMITILSPPIIDPKKKRLRIRKRKRKLWWKTKIWSISSSKKTISLEWRRKYQNTERWWTKHV